MIMKRMLAGCLAAIIGMNLTVYPVRAEEYEVIEGAAEEVTDDDSRELINEICVSEDEINIDIADDEDKNDDIEISDYVVDELHEEVTVNENEIEILDEWTEEAELIGTNFSVTASDMVAKAKSYVGKTKSGCGITETGNWCVYFTRKCASDIGITLGTTPRVTNFCQEAIDNDRAKFYGIEQFSMSKNSNYVSVSRSGFTPQPGDLLVFAWSGNTDNRYDHIGIVTEVSGTYLTYVDGNSSTGNYTTVVAHSGINWKTYSSIKGYLRPNYSGSSSSGVNRKPIGVIDNIEGLDGRVHVTGWTFDQDDTPSALNIHVYIGGSCMTGEGYNAGYADVYRPDVNNAYGCGNYHGIDKVINTQKRGWQAVYVYAIDSADGDNTLLASKTVYISNPMSFSYNESSVNIKAGTSKSIAFTFSGDGLARAECGAEDESIVTAGFDDNFSWQNTKGNLVLNAKKSGKTNAFVQFRNDSGDVVLKRTIPVTVTVAEAASITHSSSNISIQEGASANLKISWTGSEIGAVVPEFSKDDVVDSSWASTDFPNKTATMKIVGLKPGSVTYTTKLLDLDKKIVAQKSVTITVTEKPVSYSLSIQSNSMVINEKETANVNVNFTTNKISDIKVSAANSSIVSAAFTTKNLSSGNATIKLTALKPGSTTINVTLYKADGSVAVTKVISINIKELPVIYSLTTDSERILVEGKTEVLESRFSTVKISDIICATSNSDVCTVSLVEKNLTTGAATFTIKAIKPGRATVRITLLKSDGAVAISKNTDIIVSAKPTATATPTIKVTPTATATPAIKVTPTVTATPTVKATPAATVTPTVKVTPTATATPTVKVTPTATATPTVKATPAATATPVIKVTPTATATPVIKVTPTVTATPTIKVTPTATATPTAKVTPTATATPTVKVTPAATAMPTLNSAPITSDVSIEDDLFSEDDADDNIDESNQQRKNGEFLIHYKLGADNVVNANPKSYVSGAVTKLIAPTRKGYIFVAWYNNGKKMKKIPAKMSGDLTLIAKWQPIKYKIYFNKNGIDVQGKMKPVKAVFGKEYELICEYHRPGQTFMGWAKSPDGEVIYQDGEIVENLVSKKNKKITLYAIWN